MTREDLLVGNAKIAEQLGKANVLENCGIDSKVYSGFAFGLGIERMTMLKYKTNDIRLYFENDARFIQQFTAAGR